MSNAQEICRVDILWLEPGDVCAQSELGLEGGGRNRVVVFPENDEDAPIPEGEEAAPLFRLDKPEVLRALYRYEDYETEPTSTRLEVKFRLDDLYSAADPPVELLAPATIYTFDVPDAKQSWLSLLIDGDGIDEFAKDSLDDLRNIGWYLWHHGQATDDERWGVRVSFYTLWSIHVGGGEDPDVDWWLEGWVDPAKVSETKLPPQIKPLRKSTLAHRMFSMFS